MQTNLFKSITRNDFIKFSTAQLINFFETQKAYDEAREKEHDNLKKYAKELEEKIILIDNQLVILKNKFFKKSSEKLADKKTLPPKDTAPRKKSKKIKRTLLPSERYPDAPLIERHLEFKDLPNCSCCGACMEDSGMTEDTEFVTVVPAQHLVVRQKRHKYRCGKCHGDVKTAPAPKRIIPGSAYSDDMITDVALTKYCDLIPVERYCSIVGREGFKDLPPHSLIGLTHNLSDFVQGAYNKIKNEIKSSLVLHADETPHRMLEGDAKTRWYLWGFSNLESSYFDIRDTRSGDIASELLTQSKCQYLMSDVFSGYQKAVGASNKIRLESKLPLIQSVYCNAHSRRKFKESYDSFPTESKYFLDQYREIYSLEADGKTDSELLGKNRQKMKSFFEAMKKKAEELRESYSSKSSLTRAIEYFLGNYKEFTLFIDNINLPIDNNHQERQLRSPVVGRKTWYGTHSRRGAKTAAILFTLVESCKLNKVNPREYFKKLVQNLHEKKVAFTPKEFQSMNLDTC